MDEFLALLKEQLCNIASDVKELTKMAERHNVLLAEHHKRSLHLENLVQIKEKALEERLAPIEEEFKLKGRIKSRFITILGVLFTVLSIINIILKLHG